MMNQPPPPPPTPPVNPSLTAGLHAMLNPRSAKSQTGTLVSLGILFTISAAFVISGLVGNKDPHDHTTSAIEESYTQPVSDLQYADPLPVIALAEWNLESNEIIEYHSWSLCERHLEDAIRKTWNPKDHEKPFSWNNYYRRVEQENHQGPQLSYRQVITCDDNLYIVENYTYRRN